MENTISNKRAGEILAKLAKRKVKSFSCSAKKCMEERIPSRLNEKAKNSAFPKWKRAHNQYIQGNTWMKNNKQIDRYDYGS